MHFEARSTAAAKGPPGRPAEILDYRDADDLAHLLEVVLTNLSEEEHVPLEDIVVLTPAGRDKSVLRAARRGRAASGCRTSRSPAPCCGRACTRSRASSVPW